MRSRNKIAQQNTRNIVMPIFMPIFRVFYWAILFLLRLRFLPGLSIAQPLVIYLFIVNCNYISTLMMLRDAMKR